MLKLNVDRIQDAEFARRVHRVTTPKEVSYQDMLVPAFWANVAGRFTKGDKIEVLSEESSWYAEFVVVNCSRVHAQVFSLLFKEFHIAAKDKKAKVEDLDFAVEFKGPQRKWSIIRKADKLVVKDELLSKEEANDWLEENRDAVTA